MYDPEILLYPRLAKEFGLKTDSPFAPKRECDEQELKYLYTGGKTTADKVVSNIHAQSNRIVDTSQWSRNEYALVTINYDTLDQRLSRNGFSLRVRFALNKVDNEYKISKIDMCIKTIMPTGNNVVLFKQTRGEWECKLSSLEPDMGRMIRETAKKNPPLPAFFAQGGVRPEELFIESLGCSLRSVFPSYEIIARRNKIIVPEFHHTIDKNVFMTPYGDILTSGDDEMEAEFVGIHGLKPDELKPDQYEKLMRKSMELLDRTIVSSSPANIQRNLLSKAVRARNALEIVYGPDVKTVLSQKFNMDQRIEEASRFSLSQGLTAADLNIPNLWHNVGHLQALREREQVPEENPFRFNKLAR
jgi:hypothetical protein